MFLVLSRSYLCATYWSQVLSREWRCSRSSTGRRCSNYIWVINSFRCVSYQSLYGILFWRIRSAIVFYGISVSCYYSYIITYLYCNVLAYLCQEERPVELMLPSNSLKPSIASCYLTEQVVSRDLRGFHIPETQESGLDKTPKYDEFW